MSALAIEMLQDLLKWRVCNTLFFPKNTFNPKLYLHLLIFWAFVKKILILFTFKP